MHEARHTAAVVDLVARRVPAGLATCLVRSLTVLHLLRRRGITPDLRIGVRRSGGRLLAHAWIELDGSPINDSDDVALRHAAFDSSVLDAAIWEM